MSPYICVVKQLTPVQAARALKLGLQLNPENATAIRTVERTVIGRKGGASRLVMVSGNRWPSSGKRFGVQFLDNPSAALRARILAHMNAWSASANVSFEETKEVGIVRISRVTDGEGEAGCWSYIGTQLLGIEAEKPTLNLAGFTMSTPDPDFGCIVKHLAGHTLGFEHERLSKKVIARVDRKKAIAYFDITQGWKEPETKAEILTPLAKESITGAQEGDSPSVMTVHLPGKVTRDGEIIIGGLDITEKDYAFAAQVYPKPEGQAKPDGSEAETQTKGIAAKQQADACDDIFNIVILDEFEPEPGQKVLAEVESEEGKKGKKPKYARVFASFGGARVSGVMRLHADDNEPRTAFREIIAIHERIKSYTNRERGSLPSDPEMVEFGGYLFETLFQDVALRGLYNEARARQHNRKLNVILTSMIAWIAEKPWEFAYDTVRKTFLATEEIYLLRNVVTAVPANVIPPRDGPLRILVVSSQPINLGRLSVEEEEEVIRRGFAHLEEAGMVVVKVLARATPGRIHDRLSRGQYDVVHFIGHGKFDEKTEKGFLAFEDDRGGQLLLDERSVREIFCQRGIRLVFLNACQSGTGGRSDFNKGIAQSLVAHGLPALVANQYSVLDSSATSFAQYFYRSLAQGMSIGKAACEARIAVNYSMEGELIDWAVPVVYARDPNMTICTPREDHWEAVKKKSLAIERRGTQSRAMRVAVWDIDNSFPFLGKTLDKLNEAQPVFGFKIVSISTPLGAWDIENRAIDGSPYLWAEKLANRLERMTVELRADLLVCITRHWLRDDRTRNLYGWWPDNKKPQVAIFSWAGFDALKTAGTDTERAIANCLVKLLAGFLTGCSSHEEGAKDCPLFYNQKRSLESLINPQRFDPACAAELKQKIPKEFPALEQLLNVIR